MELEKVFSQFPKYRTNIRLRDFNAKLKKDNNITRNIWSVSLMNMEKICCKKQYILPH